LKGGRGDVGEVLIAIDHMTPNHQPQLLDGHAELFRGLGLGVMGLPGLSRLHASIWIVDRGIGHPQLGRALICTEGLPDVLMYYWQLPHNARWRERSSRFGPRHAAVRLLKLLRQREAVFADATD